MRRLEIKAGKEEKEVDLITRDVDRIPEATQKNVVPDPISYKTDKMVLFSKPPAN
jgi:hypothetical protein